MIRYEPWHGISNNVVCATSKASDQPAHARSLIRAFVCSLNILCDWKSSGVAKLKRGLQRLVGVYTCPNATLLEITCHGSILYHISISKQSRPWSDSSYKSCLIWVCSVCKSVKRPLYEVRGKLRPVTTFRRYALLIYQHATDLSWPELNNFITR